VARSGAQTTGKKQRVQRKAAEPQFREAALTPEQEARLAQARLLADPRVRSIWPRLTKAQQNIVHDPSRAVGHRYPLTSSELAELTGLSQKQVQYWADHKLIPRWLKGRRRLFESVGLIVAFSIANSKQNDLQFYRELLEAPIEKVTDKMGILTSVLETRMQNASPAEAKELTAALDDLAHR
jgi:DNA-binding transcriptional MerR regulator